MDIHADKKNKKHPVNKPGFIDKKRKQRAISPLEGALENVILEIDINGTKLGDEYQVVSIEVNKQVNRISMAKVTILLPHGFGDDKTFEISEAADLVPGKEIDIKVGYSSKNKSIFKGLIVGHGIEVRPDKANVLVVQCSDKAVKMTLGRKTAYFKEKTDSNIIKEVIENNGVRADVESTAFAHPQLIQYHAVDWDFALTRAEANGLIAYYEEDKLSIKKPTTSDPCGLELTYGKDVIAFNAEIDARYQMPSITTHSWDPKTQDLLEGKSQEPTINAQGNIKGKSLAGDVIGLTDYEMHSTGPIDKSLLSEWAKARLLKARLAALQGEVTFIGNERPALNKTITLKGFGSRFNGEALITEIRHKVWEGRWHTTVGFGLPEHYFSENRDISTPIAGGLLPGISGLQNGTVKKIDADPDGAHRIQVDVPMIEKNGDGIWARIASFYATSNRGAFFMPEVGDEVVLGFLNNDPRYAVILGMLYSSKIKPAYTADDKNSIKAIVTKNELKLEFDDDQKILTLETPSGNKFILSDKDKSITAEDQNGNKMEMTSSGITLNSAKDVVIKAAGKMDLEAMQGVTVKSSGGDVGIEGLNVNAKAKVSFSAQGSVSAELKASGQTTVKGAMVMIN